MAKSDFDFKLVEDKWKKLWDKEKVYVSKNLSDKDIYSIDTPPPTVSGAMHIGHAFSYAQQDFIARFRRMSQGNVFYPFGTDDNGLPTERLVEKLNKVKSKEMGRTEFIELCLKILKDVLPQFVQDWKDLGISCDFSKVYSTIDADSRKISQKGFINLYKGKHIYKKKFPTIWCPECQTSIAQAELEDKEGTSLFSTLKFLVGKEILPIATTRPELLGACVAVFVNPKDKRYKKYVGKKAMVPLFGIEVPIIEDESAQIDKGTGAMMVCSYGDKFDVDAINRYKLTPKLVIEKNGKLNVAGYENLLIKDARKKILEDLKNESLIIEQKEVTHIVNVHDKCGTDIEFIEADQWFIRILNIKKELVKQADKINWYPEFMKKRYVNWVNGLEWDWSISRNRHFGIPFPVWECPKCGEIILAEEKELPVDPLVLSKKCSKCKINAVPEKMVLDTWATSSMSPVIASNLADGKIKLPFALRPQAHDIIRTWAFYTIVRAYLHEGKIPWKDIVISGNVSMGGEKMSKSKGNVIDPKKVLEEYGADALRFWAAGSKLGMDLDYQEKDLIAGKKMINKLLNASKFVFMNLQDYNGKKKPKKLEPIDELFLRRINLLIKSVTEDFENYEYSRAKQEIEQFFWKDFCDNYLEIVKRRVYQGEGDKKLSAQYTLYSSLLVINKLLAPIMPFITEEIYQTSFKKNEKDNSIHSSKWPESKEDKSKEDSWDKILELISNVRQEKSKNQKPMNAECILTFNKDQMKLVKEMEGDFENVTNSKEIKAGKIFEVKFL